jgi:hypothetical protein
MSQPGDDLPYADKIRTVTLVLSRAITDRCNDNDSDVDAWVVLEALAFHVAHAVVLLLDDVREQLLETFFMRRVQENIVSIQGNPFHPSKRQ